MMGSKTLITNRLHCLDIESENLGVQTNYIKSNCNLQQQQQQVSNIVASWLLSFLNWHVPVVSIFMMFILSSQLVYSFWCSHCIVSHIYFLCTAHALYGWMDILVFIVCSVKIVCMVSSLKLSTSTDAPIV